MAISDTQKVDLLWKKVGFSKTKTDTNANKKAPNEAIVQEQYQHQIQLYLEYIQN